MKTQVSLMVAAAVCAASVCAGDVPPSDDAFVPVLRFAVCSDTHIGSVKSDRARRLEKLFESAYRYAQGQEYKTLDALVMVGDLTNGGKEQELEALNQIIDKSIRPETALIRLMGNHESSDAGPEVWKSLVDKELDKSVVVNGFHFIGISIAGKDDGYAARIAWLEAELAKAVAGNPERPIFTFQHHHVYNTVYASRTWHTVDSEALDQAYRKYPQVVNFSGHSHGPINNPLSVRQGGYTLFGTGTLAYFGKESGISSRTVEPNASNAAQYCIVEVDANNRVRALPYNILTDDFFRTPSNTDDPGKQLVWKIDRPSDPSTFLYTRERGERSSPPRFADGAEADVESVTGSKARFSFPQALDDDCIYAYRVALRQGDTKREIKFFSEYYFEPMPERLHCEFSDLRPGAECAVDVFPINAWGKEGEPLKFSFRTGMQ